MERRFLICYFLRMKKRSLPKPTLEPTLYDILRTINEFATRIEQRLDHHDLQFEQIRSQMTSMRSEMNGMRSDMNGMQSEMNGMQAEMMGVQSKMTGMATKEDLVELKSEIISEIDHFVVLHQKNEQEIVAMQSRCGRIEAFVGMSP